MCTCRLTCDNSDTPYPLLDAGITSWNFRDKKLRNKGLRFIQPDDFPFELAGRAKDLSKSVASQVSPRASLSSVA